jgi:hypothetical protein
MLQPICCWCVPILAGLLLFATPCLIAADEPDANKTCAKKIDGRGKPDYRILYNDDSGHSFTGDAPTPESIEQTVDEVAAGGADVFLVSACDQRTYFPSKVWQTHWEGLKEKGRSFFGDIPEDKIAFRRKYIGNMASLADQCDYLETVLTRCRERGMAPGITLRMNDMHDAPWPNSHLFSRFYKQNRHFTLSASPGHDPWPRSWGGGGLNYAFPEVREHFLSLVRELAGAYDFDVLELDFMRFSFYFDRENIDAHCETMTDFIAQVREILDSTSRPIALIPRLASSPGAARQLGFDVQSWAQKELVDAITVSNMLCTSWDLPIQEFRSLVGPNVAIYAGTEVQADHRDGLPVRYLPENREMLRGLAAGYLAVGADGINTFNYFLARNHQQVTAEEFYGRLREMGSLAEARKKTRVHVLSAGAYQTVECDMPEQVPMVIRANKARRFEMLLAAEAKGQEVQLLLYFDGESVTDQLWLRIGPHPVGHALEIREGPAGKNRKSKIAVFKVPSGVIQDGKNDLIVRSESMSTTILGIDVQIRSP